MTREPPPLPDRPITLADVVAACAAAPFGMPHLRFTDDDGSLPPYDDTACLQFRPADGTWMSAWFERGSYQSLAVFDTEDAACRRFLLDMRIGLAG